MELPKVGDHVTFESHELPGQITERTTIRVIRVTQDCGNVTIVGWKISTGSVWAGFPVGESPLTVQVPAATLQARQVP